MNHNKSTSEDIENMETGQWTGIFEYPFAIEAALKAGKSIMEGYNNPADFQLNRTNPLLL